MGAENPDMAKAFVMWSGKLRVRTWNVPCKIVNIVVLVSIASTYLLRPTNDNVDVLYKLDLYVKEEKEEEEVFFFFSSQYLKFLRCLSI